MQEKEYGIVLKRFATSEHKISVLTHTIGKIALVVFNQGVMQRVQAGALVQFVCPKKQNNIHTTEQLSISLIPIAQKTDDLYWLHHLLELCYYFVPLHQPSSECFIIVKSCLVLLAYADFFTAAQWENIKKLSLGALLFVLGFFPPDYLEQAIVMTKHRLFLFVDAPESGKMGFLNKHFKKNYTISTPELDAWLLECIQSHPRVNTFKTLHFMYQLHSSFK